MMCATDEEMQWMPENVRIAGKDDNVTFCLTFCGVLDEREAYERFENGYTKPIEDSKVLNFNTYFN